MSSINKFCVMGRLVKDPELRELDNGNKVANVTIAVDRSYKDKEGNKITDFFNYGLWNKNAERICEFSKKGDIIYLEGSFKDKTIELEEGKIIHTFEPLVEEYKHIVTYKNNNLEETTTLENEVSK